MDKHFFYELANRYLDGTATPDEKRLVEAYYEQLAKEESAFPIDKRLLLKEQIFKGVQQAIHPPPRVIKMRRWWKVAAAAAIVFILAGSSWFIWFNKNNKTVSTDLAQQQ